MRTFSLFGASAIGLALGVSAQSSQTAHYTDPNTGIEFQRFYESTQVTAGYSFGIALPQNYSTDFIGQLVVPVNGSSAAGWGGVTFGGAMTSSLMYIAWADGDDVVSSFRQTKSYASPDVYTGNVKALPIANGTFVNSTHLSSTFVCSGCILSPPETFAASYNSYIFGYAVSGEAVTDAADTATAIPYHSEGYGQYSVWLSNATSTSYDTWASWATAGKAPVGSGSGIPTVPGNGTTIPPTVSNSTYDVIVAGGGSSGLIAAQRLAETGVKVLLIERGGAATVQAGASDTLPWNDTLTPYDLPALGSSMTSMTGIELCTDVASTAGCLLGGSSSINALNFIHPQEKDFNDRWPKGWKWADVEAAANRLYERNPGTTQPSADGKYYDQAAFNTMSSLLKGQGWSQVDSIESPNAKTKAFSHPSWSILDNKRAGPVRTYLPLSMNSENFAMKLNTKVTSVIRTGSTVTGVLVKSEDGSSQIYNLNAGGKVVLSAGSLSTPRILWNSGIGRSDALQAVQSGTTGVALPNQTDWIDLPVGHGLKDHPQYVLKFQSKTNFTAYNWASVPTNPPQVDQDLYDAGSGTLVQAVQRMHFWTSTNNTLDGVERFFQGTVSALTSGTITVKAFLTHGATSTGTLGMTASGNTEVATAPWMNTPADRAAMQSFLQWFLDATSSSNSSLVYTGGPNTNASSLIDTHVTGDHWLGTAKMGLDSGLNNPDGTAVVDLNTKVYGTDNLFIVDGSIHPDLPTGNTQAIIMIVAEAAAAKIAAYNVNATIVPTLPESPSSTIVSPSVPSSQPGPIYTNGTSSVIVAPTAPASAGIPIATGIAPSSTLGTVIIPSATATATSVPKPTAPASGSGSSQQETMQELIQMILDLLASFLGSKGN